MESENFVIMQLVNRKNSGSLLIEMLLAIAILGLMLPTLIGSIIVSRAGKAQEQQRSQAVMLLKEAEEAARNVRDSGWTNLPVNGVYHPVIVSGAWTLQGGSETFDGFTRQIVISDVQRDSSGTIVSSGGTVDSSTKLFRVTVTWGTPIASTITSTFYLTRQDNESFTHTTKTDFTGPTGNKSVLSGTAIVSTTGTGITDDGQVQLGAGGGSDWCNPGSSIYTTVDLPGNGDAIAISATASSSLDYIYTTTGDNASGNAVNESTVDHNTPPTSVSAVSNYNTAKSYGIYVDHAGGYVYFGQANPGHTVEIANSSNVGSVIGYFDPGGTGKSIYVSGNTGYVIVGSKLYSFDVSSKIGARSQTGVVTLNGTGYRVVVVGNNAYVVTSSTTNQLQIINTSTMTVSKSVSMGNGAPGVDVYVDSSGTYAYVVTGYLSGKSDFFIYDIANQQVLSKNYSTNGMSPTGVTVVPGGKAIIVGTGTGVETYQVLTLTDSNGNISPTHCGGTSTTNNILGISTVIQPGGNAFSYIITNNSAAELQVIQGGPGGQLATSGTFESPIFDTQTVGLSSTMFNRFVADISQPGQPGLTTIKMQVAVAAPVSSSCTNATYNYVGPNGDSNAYFTTTGSSIIGSVPFGTYGSFINPNECYRYKFYLNTSDNNYTPVLYDITTNFSP